MENSDLETQSTPLQTLNRILDLCMLALAAIAAFIVLLLLLAVCFATLSRYIFNRPFAFLIDYSTYALIFISFFGAPWLLQHKGHVAIDMLVNALPIKTKKYWNAAIDLLIALVSGTVCVIGALITWNSLINHVVIADFLSTAKWIVLVPIPVGSFFLVVQALRNFTEHFARSSKGEEVPV